MKQLYLCILILICSISAGAVVDYNSLKGKAQRFYDNDEWGSALAMYELMLQQRPDVIDTYYKAITIAGISKNEQLQTSLMERSEKQTIPFDSIFAGIRSTAISLGKPDIYVDFLTLMKTRQTWLSRAIEVELLDFYIFRSNADMMISSAKGLLVSAPDNILFLKTIGEGYSLKGEFVESMNWYRKIIEYHPQNIDALLILGNYYNLQVEKELKSNKIVITDITKNRKKIPKLDLAPTTKSSLRANAQQALKYLIQANGIKATPFVTTKIENLKILESAIR
ncbi:MAG: hypothetical protein PHR45_08505 [Muribaculaceae bacterium]|nr:hypothetical protein [Muribaculaceae bacterium]